MTRNPLFVLSDTLAVEALQKMVQGSLSYDCTMIDLFSFSFFSFYLHAALSALREVQASTCCGEW